jgi:hypothetical protein
MTDKPEHNMHWRSVGRIHAQPRFALAVHHLTCGDCDPTDPGLIGLTVVEDVADDSPQFTTVMLSLGAALALANRIERAVNLASASAEGPPNADRELALLAACSGDTDDGSSAAEDGTDES